jgi:hypothetical protein
LEPSLDTQVALLNARKSVERAGEGKIKTIIQVNSVEKM